MFNSQVGGKYKKSVTKKQRSKSKVRISVSKGKMFGYTIHDLQRDRRSLLRKILKNNWATYAQVIKRLNVLAIYNKNRHPDISDKIRKDIKYVETNLNKYSKKMSRKKKRTSRKKMSRKKTSKKIKMSTKKRTSTTRKIRKKT